jgi:hypothetical protein
MDRQFAIVVVNAIVFLCIFFISNKKITKIEMYSTALFSAFISLFLDIIMGLFLDTFFYFQKGIEPKDLIFHIIIYPMTNLLFLNYFPYHKNKEFKILHIAFWTVIALAIEVIYLKTGIFVYQNWNFTLSVISYPILFFGLYLHLKFIRLYILKN